MPRKKNNIDESQIEMMIVEKPEGKGPAELVISPKVPEQAVKTKDNVSNFIAQNMLDAGEQLLELESKGRIRKQIRTKVSFSYEGIDIQAKKDFTLFDQEVHDAIVTLYLAENKFISPAMVYRAMTGKKNSESVHASKLKKIEESIDKCMFSKLSIDASEAAALYGYDEAVYSGALLAAEKVSVVMGGHRIIAYKVMAEPLLYRYAKSCKQITAVDIKLLDTPVTKTDDTIVLQGYLLRRIEMMKTDKRNDRIILYDNIYEIVNISKNQKVQAKRTREYVKDILTYWVEEGYIRKYEIIMKRNSFYGITIFIY